jgi:hypothetical protein
MMPEKSLFFGILYRGSNVENMFFYGSRSKNFTKRHGTLHVWGILRMVSRRLADNRLGGRQGPHYRKIVDFRRPN